MRATGAPHSIDDLVTGLSPRRIRDHLGLSRERMARILDVSTRTVDRWEERTELPTQRSGRAQLARLQQLAELGRLVYGVEGFRTYLTLPMPLFGGRTALQLLEQGELERVSGALAADYEGQGY
jgi:transcriptional regulator with XRE-family HTH domain